MARILGTPHDPLMVKCTSIGQPDRDRAYLSAVTQDGDQIVLGFGLSQLLLIASQASTAAATMLADEVNAA
jgi:hypothetical protein